MAAFVLLAVLGSACASVADFIPDGDPSAGPNPDGTGSPNATPILPTPGNGSGGPLPTSAIPDHELARTVVQVQAIDDREGSATVVRVGSGVIVDANAHLILTSYPLVEPHGADGSRAYTRLGIAMTPESETNPELMFEAVIAFADPEAQVAILRIERDFDGEELSADRFVGTAAVYDGTASTTAGSALRIFGHPSPAADGSDTQPVSMTNGTVAGFRSAPGAEGRTWIKTDVRLPAPLAGGPVFDQRGVLLGVLVQEQYVASGGVGHVRPIDLAAGLIESARANPDAVFHAPIRLHTNVSGDSQVPLDVEGWASQPLFAANANETITGRDLFDYTNVFQERPAELHYEFVLAGVPNGATVEERWFLDGLQQDSVSSSYVWDGGSFGYVSDRIIAAGDAGLPSGHWRLELWVNEQLLARATAILGDEVASPEIDNPAVGSTATTFGTPADGLANGSSQLLAFFSFNGFEGVQRYSYSVFHNNQRVYQSPVMTWEYGDNGRTWVGYYDPAGTISSGSWEVEIYADGTLLSTVPVDVP